MTELRNLFFLILGLLPLACNACVTLEEGGDGYLRCGTTRPSVNQHINFQLLQNNIFEDVSTCNVNGTCRDLMPNLFNAKLTSDANNRLTNNLHIRYVRKYQNTFRCVIDGRIAGVCNIDVFVSPSKPTCSNPVVSEDRTRVSVTCKSETVYPRGICYFQNRAELNAETITTGVISHRTTPSTVSPGNNATECTLTLDRSSLPRKFYQLRVLMNPDIVDRSKGFALESEYTCPFVTNTAYAPQPICSENSGSGAPQDFGTRLCVSIEEGQNGYFSCSTTRDNVEHSLTIQNYVNGVFTNLSTCNPQGQCQIFQPSDYSVVFSEPSASRIQQTLNFLSADRNKNIFKCLIDDRNGGTCRIGVFVNPTKPTCDSPRLSGDGQFVTVKCRTVNVYPRAQCIFTNETNQILAGEILYQETVSTVNPRNKATECTIFVPKSTLTPGTYEFRVAMYSLAGLASVPLIRSDPTPPIQIEG